MKRALAKVRALLKKGENFRERYGKSALKVYFDDGVVFLLLTTDGSWAGREYGSNMADTDGVIGGFNTRALTAARYFRAAGLITEAEHDKFRDWWGMQEVNVQRASDLSRAEELVRKHGYKVCRDEETE